MLGSKGYFKEVLGQSESLNLTVGSNNSKNLTSNKPPVETFPLTQHEHGHLKLLQASSCWLLMASVHNGRV